VPHIDWRKLYEAAMLEMNPDKLAICIGAAEQAIAQQESFVDVSELERRKLSDARSMLKSSACSWSSADDLRRAGGACE